MTSSSSSKKQAQDPPETSEPTLKSLRTKMTKSDEKVLSCLYTFSIPLLRNWIQKPLNTKNRIFVVVVLVCCNGQKKLKDIEISVPLVYGNIAFWLGKKASE